MWIKYFLGTSLLFFVAIFSYHEGYTAKVELLKKTNTVAPAPSSDIPDESCDGESCEIEPHRQYKL